MRTRRIFRALVAIAVAAAILLPAAPALAGIPAGRYAIGDSVMLGARPALIGRGFRVNAEVSRQFDDSIRLVRDLAAGGHLPVNVIVHLGTNGLIDGADCDRLVHVAGRDRHGPHAGGLSRPQHADDHRYATDVGERLPG